MKGTHGDLQFKMNYWEIGQMGQPISVEPLIILNSYAVGWSGGSMRKTLPADPSANAAP